MTNSYMTVDMITREAIQLFKNSNFIIMNIDAQYSNLFEATIETIEPMVEVLTAKEVVVLGTAAVIAKNPKVTRRFWDIFK